eukprot:GCRY01004042.1.p1 GENE.GCRY01004042.1~~GCRY01004042.1.p1  ORF type:complete len:289 (+),score=12.68 GCRY01004042.1:198-1064(+)
MGFCKCRKPSERFCFNHKIYVCDDCVLDHPFCTLKPYIEWLQDSEFQTLKCPLCSSAVNIERCIRLPCYHVFHHTCLQSHFSNFSSPDFCCPKCSAAINTNIKSNALGRSCQEFFDQIVSKFEQRDTLPLVQGDTQGDSQCDLGSHSSPKTQHPLSQRLHANSTGSSPEDVNPNVKSHDPYTATQEEKRRLSQAETHVFVPSNVHPTTYSHSRPMSANAQPTSSSFFQNLDFSKKLAGPSGKGFKTLKFFGILIVFVIIIFVFQLIYTSNIGSATALPVPSFDNEPPQ